MTQPTLPGIPPAGPTAARARRGGVSPKTGRKLEEHGDVPRQLALPLLPVDALQDDRG